MSICRFFAGVSKTEPSNRSDFVAVVVRLSDTRHTFWRVMPLHVNKAMVNYGFGG